MIDFDNETIDLAEELCSTTGPLLIIGEIGTGKDVLAAYIADNILERSQEKYFKIDCSNSTFEVEKALFGSINPYADVFDEDRYNPGFLENAIEGAIYFDRIHLANKGTANLIKSVLNKEPYKPRGGSELLEVGNVWFLASCEPHPFDGDLGYVPTSLRSMFSIRKIVLKSLRQKIDYVEGYLTHFIQEFSTELKVELDRSVVTLLCSLPNNLSGLRSLARKLVDSIPEGGTVTAAHIIERIEHSNSFLSSIERVRKYRCECMANDLIYQTKSITGEMIYSWIAQFEPFRTTSSIDPRDIAETIIKNIIDKYYYNNSRLEQILNLLVVKMFESIETEIKKNPLIIPDQRSPYVNRTIAAHMRAAKDEIIFTNALGLMRSPETLSNSLRKIIKIKPNQSAVEFHNLPTVVKQRKGHLRVLLIDDFLGSGRQIEREVIGRILAFKELREAVKRVGSKISFYMLVCVGFDVGQMTVESILKNNYWFDFNLLVGENLDSKDRAFHKNSVIFPHNEIRTAGKELVIDRIGNSLCNISKGENPHGWNDIESLVVFESNVPNNTLPIIWKHGYIGRNQWRALFPRLTVG